MKRPSREDVNAATAKVDAWKRAGKDPNNEIHDACAYYGHIPGNVPRVTVIACLAEYWNELRT